MKDLQHIDLQNMYKNEYYVCRGNRVANMLKTLPRTTLNKKNINLNVK